MRFFFCLVATALIFLVGPIFWTPERNTDAIHEQGEILQGYVDSFDDTNWREVVPKVKDATHELNDAIYRLREKLGDDKPWNEKPWYWIGTFAVLMYVVRKRTPDVPPAKPGPRPGYGPDRQPVVYMTPGPRKKPVEPAAPENTSMWGEDSN